VTNKGYLLTYLLTYLLNAVCGQPILT